MKQTHTRAKRLGAMLLSIAVMLSLLPAIVGSDGDAQAVRSLDAIELIKKQGGIFNILEVVPNASSGSVGYLVSGQEPFAGWEQKLAGIESAASRKTYADAIFGALTPAGVGLLSGGTSTPLTIDGGRTAYTEAYPWQAHDGLRQLTLDAPETLNVKGTMNYDPENGDYYYTGGYSIDTANGKYVQSIDYFTQYPPSGGEYYYYVPTFTKLNNPHRPAVGAALYTKKIGNNYVYANVRYTEDVDNNSYYYVSGIEEGPYNSDGHSWDKRYAAISTDFIYSEDGGDFSRADKTFTYSAAGGDYSFSSGSTQYSLTTDTIFYTSIHNNDWLLKKALDWSESDSAINAKVSTVPASELTQSDIDGASLIVLSRGFEAQPSGFMTRGYDANTDLSYTMSDALETAAVKTPVVLDSALISEGALEIEKLTFALSGGVATPRVDKTLYVATFPLAKGFLTPFYSETYDETDAPEPFRMVYAQISEAVQGGITELEQTVCPATALRYIIAYARINANVKGSIRVLEIQPGNTGELSPAEVRRWIDSAEDEKADTEIIIDTMSTYELVGKADSIAEKYDIVYIGSSIADLKTKEQNGETITDFNDNTMDGLVYTNVGDTVVAGGDSGFSMSGLLDRDYASNAFSDALTGNSYNSLKTGYRSFGDIFELFEHYNDTTRTFRYSGNDLTPQLEQELEKFAEADYPIVVASDLMGRVELSEGDPDACSGKCEYTFIDLPSWLKWLELTLHCNYRLTLEKSSSAMSVTAFLTYAATQADSRVSKADIKWYKVGTDEPVKSETVDVYYRGSETNAVSTLDLSAPNCGEGVYYCTADATHVSIGSSSFEVSPNNKELARSEKITATNTIKTDKVDNSSYMYQLLAAIKDKPNVMARWQTAVSSYSDKLKLYANLEKPTIEFTVTDGKENKPPEYSRVGSTVSGSLSSSSLNFEFQLKGVTGDEYTCTIYVDDNGDGRFTNGELLFTKHDMAANMTHSVSVPVDSLGVIPWRLSMQCETKDYLHCSKEGFAYIAPPEGRVETLNILQINSSTGGMNLETNAQFSDPVDGLFKQVESEFKVNMMTVRADELDTLLKFSSVPDGTVTHYQKYIDDKTLPVDAGDSENLVAYLRAKANAGISYATLSDFLKSFDMLIMGFGDKYSGITASSAESIVEFIGTGKSTLFSHDCTSFYFLPLEGYRTENWSESDSDNLIDLRLPNYVYSSTQVIDPSFSMFGYDFNMTIRDAVGLDRYGVTSRKTLPDNTRVGLTKYAAPVPEGDDNRASGLVNSNAYLSLTEEQAQQLRGENFYYSVAYKPKSARADTVAETQGLTNGVLTRFYISGGRPTGGSYTAGTEMTAHITQVNRGRITTYPFDVNTSAFGGTADAGEDYNTISIGETHEQYDQLNLNSGDVTVWYCLAGGEFDYMPNDAINSYYIYNDKNVTYTGFGHFEDEIKSTDTVNENEAKLLVNTIIASYRSIAPEISFRDATGRKQLEEFFIPSDGGEIITAGITQGSGVLQAAADPDRRIHFSVGKNAEQGELLKARFYIEGNEATLTPQVYYQNNGEEKSVAATESLKRGVTYYVKLDELLALLSTATDAAWSDGLVFTARLSINDVVSAGDSLTFRKLNLFNLS